MSSLQVLRYFPELLRKFDNNETLTFYGVDDKCSVVQAPPSQIVPIAFYGAKDEISVDTPFAQAAQPLPTSKPDPDSISLNGKGPKRLTVEEIFAAAVKVNEAAANANAAAKAARKKSNLKKNVSNVHKYECKLCNLSYGLKQQLDAHEDEKHFQATPFTCPTCSTRYKTKGRFAHHVKYCGYKEFKCEKCPKAFKKARSLRTHRKYKHGPPKPTPHCRFCGKDASNKQELSIHIANHHKDQLTKVCRVCGKGFLTKMELKAHLKIHSKEKPYRCTACLSQYTVGKAFVKHCKIVHGNEKPFECKICKGTFGVESTLNEHIASHSRQERLKPYDDED